MGLCRLDIGNWQAHAGEMLPLLSLLVLSLLALEVDEADSGWGGSTVLPSMGSSHHYYVIQVRSVNVLSHPSDTADDLNLEFS